MQAVKHPLLFKLSTFSVALALVVVVLGAFTRLVDAGLGCPDWPGCYGHLLWPDSAHEILLAETAFPDAPVEAHKTWPEMVHRYFAGMLGLTVLGILIVSVKAFSSVPQSPLKLPAFLLFLVILQAAFGMWTVTLKLWPQIVTAHLLGGFATLSLLWLMAQRTGGYYWRVTTQNVLTIKKLRPFAVVALIAVVVQIALGGWTSSNYAAIACPDLPKCHGLWWPKANFIQGFDVFQKVGPNYLGGLLDNHARTAIHLSHRLGAVVASVCIVAVVLVLWLTQFSRARLWAGVLASILVLQVSLGVSNVAWALPLPVAVAHNAVGAILLLVLVAINHRIFTYKTLSEAHHG